MFKSTEKTALQEIGPRFTLKLRSVRNGLPQNNNLGVAPKPLEMARDESEDEELEETASAAPEKKPKTEDGDFAWSWNVCRPDWLLEGPMLISMFYSRS